MTVSHLSWTAILTTAIRLKQHAGVADPEQAWNLGELIHYLEHPSSAALSFEDMGQYWVPIRDGARADALNKRNGWLMDGLDERTAGRLDELAASAGTAQNGQDTFSPPLPTNAETPAEAGVSGLQPRPGSNWRYRLERPAS